MKPSSIYLIAGFGIILVATSITKLSDSPRMLQPAQRSSEIPKFSPLTPQQVTPQQVRELIAKRDAERRQLIKDSENDEALNQLRAETLAAANTYAINPCPMAVRRRFLDQIMRYIEVIGARFKCETATCDIDFETFDNIASFGTARDRQVMQAIKTAYGIGGPPDYFSRSPICASAAK